ncbi:MAG: hypothetical protein AAF502_14555 [Bacteroidota bacterium]
MKIIWVTTYRELAVLLAFLCCFTLASAQDNNRIAGLETQLEAFSKKSRGLNDRVDISITSSLKEVVTALADETRLNVTLDHDLDMEIAASLPNARVKDILLHLCDAYQLDLKFTGEIIRVTKFEEEKEETVYEINADYNPFNGFLTISLKNDTLKNVLEKIVQLTDENVIAEKEISQTLVSGYYQRVTLENALELMTKSNNLVYTKTDQDYYLISKAKAKEELAEIEESNTSARTTRKKSKNPNLNIEIETDSIGQIYLDVDAYGVPVADIIEEASDLAGFDYFIFEQAAREGVNVSTQSQSNRNNRSNRGQAAAEGISLKLTGVTYEELLDFLMRQTNSTFQVENGVYLIGDRSEESLRASKVVQIQHRPVNDILEAIPEEIQENVEITELPQLNSVMLSGSYPNILEIEEVLENLDRPVPNVNIELIIMEVTRKRNTETGINAGIGQPPRGSSQSVFPTFDYNFNAGQVNSFLDWLGNNGIVNIGPVPVDFYLQLKAAEDVGWGKVHSKPQLSTLNAQEATFSIGETQYYVNEQSIVTPGITPVVQETRKFEKLDADFSITVTPVISGDENVTLDIIVNQSDFIPAGGEGLPPGSATREFESKIRVKNQEMIVLGGLERKLKEETGRGVPGLSRIPVLKWFFSSKTKKKEKSELLIFVKPTISY